MPSKSTARLPQPSLKRKQLQQPEGAGRQRKRQKSQDARTVAFQTSGKAFKNGELDVDKFVKAREFEIRALNDGMTRSKQSSANRAFQDVPRDLRRRTASHNVKRVPKRLKKRAAKEMDEDNTPTVTARGRKKTGKSRLRLETIKRLQAITGSGNDKTSKQKKKGGKKEAGTDATQPVLVPKKAPKVKKNILQDPPVPKAKFRKRQIHKSWLPTHIFHAKRAQMTAPKDPLWRFAIPITPTAKSYRPTHRAASQRSAIAWDTSYMSTIGLEGTETALIGLLKALNVDGLNDHAILTGKSGSKWRVGSRAWHGWVYEQHGWPNRAIAPLTIVWCAQSTSEVPPTAEKPTAAVEEEGEANQKTAKSKRRHWRRVMLRISPSAFLQLWKEVLRLSKIQKPQVLLEDLRFEIGSIEIVGPASTEALLGTLKPCEPDGSAQHPSNASSVVWQSLGALTNPALLPPNALINLMVKDPRLQHPHRSIRIDNSPAARQALLETLAAWPLDKEPEPSRLFSRDARLRASRLPSQRSINRRKSSATPGVQPDPTSLDPAIPALLLASRAQGATGEGAWTLLLPWKCVQPVWYSLMFYLLSTGGTIRFGGLQETRQVMFENGQPWFPADFPGTLAGMDWEMRERDRRKTEWDRRPRGKRVEWATVDLGKDRKGEIGRGWACDWERLIHGRASPGEHKSTTREGESGTALPLKVNGREVPEAETTEELVDKTARRHVKDVEHAEPAQQGGPGPAEPAHSTSVSTISHLAPAVAATMLRQQTPPPPRARNGSTTTDSALATIRITCLDRGVPQPCARIYRLPTADAALRARWLSLLATTGRGARRARASDAAVVPPASQSRHQHLSRLAASILAEPAGAPNHPVVPDELDLVGFVTSGNFNLREGRGSGLASVSLGKLLSLVGADAAEAAVPKEDPPPSPETRGEDRLCIVRAAGAGLGRLARWQPV